MELFVLGLLFVVCYLAPLIFCIYLAFKEDHGEVFGIFCWVPMMNFGLAVFHFEEMKEKREYQEKKAKGLAEIEAWTDFYYVEIAFLDGSFLETPHSRPYWSKYSEKVISSFDACEQKINGIINRGYYELNDIKYLYHTMDTITIKKWEE